MNVLKTLMILALLAQPLCAVACDLSMDTGASTHHATAEGGHACCDPDDDSAPADRADGDHCADCASAGTLTVAATAPLKARPGAELPGVEWRPDAPSLPPSPRPPNA